MKKSGFTLIEIMVIVAFIGIITGLTAPLMNNFFSRQQLNAMSDEVVANLRRAQNKAIISEGNVNWGVSCRASNYAIIKDPSEAAIEAEIYEFPENISVVCNDVNFDKLTGKTVSSIVNITSSVITEQKNININEQGAIEIQ